MQAPAPARRSRSCRPPVSAASPAEPGGSGLRGADCRVERAQRGRMPSPKRLSSKGYAALRADAGQRQRRRCSAFASARVQLRRREAENRRGQTAKRKSSSSPGSRANRLHRSRFRTRSGTDRELSSRLSRMRWRRRPVSLLALSFPKFGHPAVGLDRARAACCVALAGADAAAARLRARSAHRRGLFRRHATGSRGVMVMYGDLAALGRRS